MRVLPSVLFCSALLASHVATASDEAQLIESINAYRSEVRSCAGKASEELPPLAEDRRLVLPIEGVGDLQQSLARVGYPMVTVQAISLSGPRDAPSAAKALRESFCQVLLDPQFVDIGVNRDERDWRIVLARPLLGGHLGDWQAEGQRMLEQLNALRAQPRRCVGQDFAAAPPLRWNATLAITAEAHSRAMANDNFFGQLGDDGRTPGDRAELAGYAGAQVAQNIGAALDAPRKVVDGWLTNRSHCANLMNPHFTELGAAYAVDPKSDAGIYWTALFGAP